MKILRNTEWEPVGWAETFPGLESPAYLFKHKQYGDVVALKVAKWIDVPRDKVYFYNALNHTISVSGRRNMISETSLPNYRVAMAK